MEHLVESSKKEILNILITIIQEIIGDEWLDDKEINSQTSIANDLEMESIEVVELAEKIKAYYGDRVDFVKWMSSMELDQIINLTIGEVVDYIDTCLN